MKQGNAEEFVKILRKGIAEPYAIALMRPYRAKVVTDHRATTFSLSCSMWDLCAIGCGIGMIIAGVIGIVIASLLWPLFACVIGFGTGMLALWLALRRRIYFTVDSNLHMCEYCWPCGLYRYKTASVRFNQFKPEIVPLKVEGIGFVAKRPLHALVWNSTSVCICVAVFAANEDPQTYLDDWPANLASLCKRSEMTIVFR